MPDGAAIHEVLSEVDASAQEFQYKITDGPFPITDYLSTVKVSSTGKDTCKVTWGCEFNVVPEAKSEMVQLFEGFYNIIIDNLENLINE